MAMITATEIVGMRVGIKVSNQIEDNNQVEEKRTDPSAVLDNSTLFLL